ncbi:MAG: hypothetical protein ACPIA2_16545, partial [Mariniblastus sp.]
MIVCRLALAPVSQAATLEQTKGLGCKGQGGYQSANHPINAPALLPLPALAIGSGRKYEDRT